MKTNPKNHPAGTRLAPRVRFDVGRALNAGASWASVAALAAAATLQPAPSRAAEAEIARIETACVTVRRQFERTCACFTDMAADALDDREQALLAAWLENDYAEAARVLRDLPIESSSRVASFEARNLVFCSQYS